MSKIIYQSDAQGWYIGAGEADESPLEPGVYLIPAMAYADAPPDKDSWPSGTMPRRSAGGWVLQAPPTATEMTATEKLAAFLAAHPDVAQLIGAS